MRRAGGRVGFGLVSSKEEAGKHQTPVTTAGWRENEM